jgi:hypothetical protein
MIGVFSNQRLKSGYEAVADDWIAELVDVDDLNSVALATDTMEDQPLSDPSVRSNDGSIEVVFRNIERRLISEIKSAEIVVGCVAWLTSGPVLDALAETTGVSVVVQKEDFLRPDLGAPGQDAWKDWLRGKYERLPEGPHRYEYAEIDLVVHERMWRSDLGCRPVSRQSQRSSSCRHASSTP